MADLTPLIAMISQLAPVFGGAAQHFGQQFGRGCCDQGGQCGQPQEQWSRGTHGHGRGRGGWGRHHAWKQQQQQGGQSQQQQQEGATSSEEESAAYYSAFPVQAPAPSAEEIKAQQAEKFKAELAQLADMVCRSV